MTDITTYPMIDDFDTTLSQAWDWATWTVYLSEAVGITIPAGTTTYIVVNPWKSTMQVAKINAVDNSAKTATVSSISVDKWAWVAYTQQTHPVGSVVRISSNYAFWKDIVDGVNSKVDTNSNDVLIYKYADATARDAGLPSPTNWTQVYLTSEGKWTDYIAWSRQDRDQGTVTANASTTVAGKWEQSTPVQLANWDETWETWAKLFATPKDLSAQIQSGTWVYWADAWGDNTYVVALTPTLSAYTIGQSLYAKVTTANTWACSFDFWPWAKNVKTLDWNNPQTWAVRGIVHLIYDWTNLILQNEDIASEWWKWVWELATIAEVIARADTWRLVTPAWIWAVTEIAILQWTRAANTASWTQTIAHWMTNVPRWIEINAQCNTSTASIDPNPAISHWRSNWTVHKCTYSWTLDAADSDSTAWNDASNCIHIIAYWTSWESLQVATAAFDATNITLTRTFTEDTTANSNTIYFTIFAHS